MRFPALRFLRTRYPDLAGVVLRDWERQGFLASYRHHPDGGFYLIAVRPRWRWLLRVVSWLGGGR